MTDGNTSIAFMDMAERAFAQRDDLVKALTEILAANKRFRAGMPGGWEGDPLQDACERAAAVLDRVGGSPK
jgi:hypothetical protein